MGRSLQLDKVAHNRLWMTIAHAMGHEIPSFGKASLCQEGILNLAVTEMPVHLAGPALLTYLVE